LNLIIARFRCASPCAVAFLAFVFGHDWLPLDWNQNLKVTIIGILIT